MPKTGGAGSDNPFVLSNIPGIVSSPEGGLWTDQTLEELLVRLGGSQRTIPHSGYHRCTAIKTSDQFISSSTWTSVVLDDEIRDVGDLHDNVTNNTRITIQRDGEYRFFYQTQIDIAEKVQYNSRILEDGSVVVPNSEVEKEGLKEVDFINLNLVTPLLSLTSGHYYELQVWHDSLAVKTLHDDNTFFGIQRFF